MIRGRLARYIKSKGLTLSEVALKIGVTRQVLARYGEVSGTTLKTLKKVAKAMTSLGVPTKATELFEVVSQKDIAEG